MLIKKVLDLFNARKIPYALVGGYAVSLHGAVRGTVDIDFVVPLEEKILIQIEEGLNSLGFVSKIPVSAKQLAQFRDEYIENKNLKVWTFVDPNLPVEVIDILILYDLKEFKVETKKTIFGEVRIVSLADLIRMKKAAGRPQDIADIEALEKIQYEKENA